MDRSATVGRSPTTNALSRRCVSATPRNPSSRLRRNASTCGSAEGINARWKRCHVARELVIVPQKPTQYFEALLFRVPAKLGMPLGKAKQNGSGLCQALSAVPKDRDLPIAFTSWRQSALRVMPSKKSVHTGSHARPQRVSISASL